MIEFITKFAVVNHYLYPLMRFPSLSTFSQRTAAIMVAVAIFSILLTACSTSRSSIKQENTNSYHYLEKVKSMHHLDQQQKLILEEAYTWLGTPYTYAMQDKGIGTDCSGMVMSIYQKVIGCKLPRNSAKQAEYCQRIKEKNARIGDLVFFATGKDPDKISHVGIIVDEDNFIHASTSKGVVISKLHTPYYTGCLKMYGRVPKSQADKE